MDAFAKSPLRVLYFAVSDTGYPRNERLRAYLSSDLGAHVDVFELSSQLSAIVRFSRAVRYVWRTRGERYDFVILSEFSLLLSPLSWLAAQATGATHIVDFFVGYYETEVDDFKSTRPNSLRAKVLSFVDKLSVVLADVCVTDTDVRATRFYHAFGGRCEFFSLPVGAPRWAAQPLPEGRRGGPVRILFYGSYLPLHGLDAMVEGLIAADLGDFSLTMVGDGPLRGPIEESLRQKVNDLTFEGSVPVDRLLEIILESDIVLGAFGESSKALSVIPNKVWQGLSLGKLVVTRDNDAMVEIKPIAEANLFLARSSRPAEIAYVLSAAAAVTRRGRVGYNATGAFLEHYVWRRYNEFFGHLLERVH